MTGSDGAVSELHCTTIAPHQLQPCCWGYFVCLSWIEFFFFFGNHLLEFTTGQIQWETPHGKCGMESVCKSSVGEKWEFILCWLGGDSLNGRMRMGSSGRDRARNMIILPGPSSTFVDQETQNHRVVKIGRDSKIILSITTFSTQLEHWFYCFLNTALGSSLQNLTTLLLKKFLLFCSLVELEAISYWEKRLTPSLPTGQCCCAVFSAFLAMDEAQSNRSLFFWCCQLSWMTPSLVSSWVQPLQLAGADRKSPALSKLQLGPRLGVREPGHCVGEL